ncbi:MAG: hypothetical protein ACK40G_01555 [Cytophagaceae bacterium]
MVKTNLCFIGLLLSLVFIFNSCCTKKDCVDLGLEFIFPDMDKDEVATGYIVSFNKSSNFNNPLDTIYFDYNHKIYGFRISNFNGKPVESLDFKVIFPNPLDLSYEITDVSIKKEVCNSDFLKLFPCNYYKKANNYRLNGQIQNSFKVYIRK